MSVPSVKDRREALAKSTPVWQERTIDAAFVDFATLYADRLYVIGDDDELTYAQTQTLAERYAEGLRALGVGHGDRVALLFTNYSIFAPLCLAAWRLGASIIPVNFSYRTAELDYLLRQSKCKILITMDEFRQLDYLAMLDETAPGWQERPSEHYPYLEKVIVWKGRRGGAMTLEDLGILGDRSAAALPPSPASPSETAIIMYTSGTTGTPKGVQITHDQVLRNTYTTCLHRAYEDGRRIIFSLPLYHAFGLIVGLLAVPWVGGGCVLRPMFDPEDIMKNIERYRPTDALFVPTMAMAIVEHPRLKDYDLSSLFACLSSAAATPRRIWETLITGLGLTELVTGYGMTELTACELMTEPDDGIDRLELTIGHVINAGIAGIPEHGGVVALLRFVNPETGEDVAIGEEGEMWWKTPVATSGYFEMPEATASLYAADGWLKSGDLGRMRSDGYVQLTGRAKEQYKTGGELVAPKEVETVLNTHPDVAQSYVFGIPDERWGEIGAALVVPVVGRSPTEQELQEWTKVRLAKYKWPRHVFFCTAEELPKTATGKVQKFRMVEMAQDILKERCAHDRNAEV